MTKIEELEKEVNDLKQAVASLMGHDISTVKYTMGEGDVKEPSVFRPKEGEDCCFLDSAGEPMNTTFIAAYDEARIKYSLLIGRTQEACETFRRVHDRYHELMEGVELSEYNTYELGYNHEENEVAHCTGIMQFGTRLMTIDIAKTLISEFSTDELRLWITGEH